MASVDTQTFASHMKCVGRVSPDRVYAEGFLDENLVADLAGDEMYDILSDEIDSVHIDSIADVESIIRRVVTEVSVQESLIEHLHNEKRKWFDELLFIIPCGLDGLKFETPTCNVPVLMDIVSGVFSPNYSNILRFPRPVSFHFTRSMVQMPEVEGLYPIDLEPLIYHDRAIIQDKESGKDIHLYMDRDFYIWALY